MAARILGVLGGMGPRASAEFVRTVYQYSACGPEQAMPRLLLHSDPLIQDRTAAIARGDDQAMVVELESRLRDLLAVGATRLLVVCFTAHHFLPSIDLAVRTRLISLVDTAIAILACRPGRYLMLCTEGTAAAQVFQRAPGWPLVADRVVFPSATDQAEVHAMIYRIKEHGADRENLDAVHALRDRYRCAGVIVGCTEFHLVSSALAASGGEESIVDPLRSIAFQLNHSTGSHLPEESTMDETWERRLLEA